MRGYACVVPAAPRRAGGASHMVRWSTKCKELNDAQTTGVSRERVGDTARGFRLPSASRSCALYARYEARPTCIHVISPAPRLSIYT
jgi:hypothetical protein